jgi:hypothetical protein
VKLISRPNAFWTLLSLALSIGIVTGFSLPLAGSYQSQRFYQPTFAQLPKAAVVIMPSVSPVPATVAAARDRDSEVARLAARNRRLEALVAGLRQRVDATAQRPGH